MSQNPSLVVGPTADTRRRARLVLWAAGAIALLGLVGGGIASSHLTSSLSDYDAPGSAVVLAQHQIQRVTGSNPEEGYDRRRPHCRADQRVLAPSQPEWRRWCRSSGPARRSRASSTTPTPANPSMISSNGTLTTVVATVGAVQRTEGRHRPAEVHRGPAVAEGQHLARRPHCGRRPDRSRLITGPRTGRALRPAVPAAAAVLRVPRSSGRCGATGRSACSPSPSPSASWASALVVVPLSIFALNLVIALGIGLSVDFSLLDHLPLPRRGPGKVLRSTPPWPRSVGLRVTPSCSARSPSPRRWPPWPSSPSASSTRWGSPARSSSWLLVRSPCSSCRRS